MGKLDDGQIADMLRAAFEAGRKMEQLIVDGAIDRAIKHGEEKMGECEAGAAGAIRNAQLSALRGGLAALGSVRAALANKRERAEVQTHVVRMSEAEIHGCGVCEDCVSRARKDANERKGN